MIAKNNITIEKEKRQLLSSWTLELAQGAPDTPTAGHAGRGRSDVLLHEGER